MSEDEGPESGCDTVEGSPASDASASPRANGPYRYLDNNNRPPLAAMVVPLPSPAAQGRSPRGVRTMVVPPMRVQNNNTGGMQEGVQRTGRSIGRAFFLCVFLCCMLIVWVHFILCIRGFMMKLQLKPTWELVLFPSTHLPTVNVCRIRHL